ncbi:hypothetical protein Aeqsu_1401 [Aequorivita sublithincola DSM 14238]|uniref:Ferredoxin subunit of nitrite reductase and ring-hydroxylating dioxygenase n=1 Tax=Aequorivita sublithincola (strain DSM 14238 / LMG 21431 / ACAM 643 / 9-3) TaxID=746697 RepID=I3YV76_AEQSU|nr:hypothetical protein [Aequorivita sublithincola]AFL80894.1 hypothetical protein Aeqsu_1401 [Aequorivita sublithincola DSM 14238]
MKNKFLFLLLSVLIMSCSKKDDKQERNPYLTDPAVRINLNLNLPEYNKLKFPGESVIVGQGIKGIVVYCANESLYFAFDLTDPNHAPSNCSRMELDGVIASCPCQNDDNKYYITTGQHIKEPDTKYPMQSYRVERNGNSILVSN